MAAFSPHLRSIIAQNIRRCRFERFPGRGGGKRCADAVGVTPQLFLAWERGLRTPDELQLKRIAELFGKTVLWMRTDHRDNPHQTVQQP